MSSRVRTAYLALILFAFGWRTQGLDNQSLWRDEVDAVWFATRHLPDTLVMFTLAGQNGPLYFLILRPWFSLVGTSEFALRFVSAAAGTLSVALLWQVARVLIPPKQPHAHGDNGLQDQDSSVSVAGSQPRTLNDNVYLIPLLSAAFLATNPYQIWYGQEGKMYTLTAALVLLVAWFFWKGITVGGWRPWLGFTVVVTLSIYVHLLLILLYPFFFFWFLLAWPLSKHHVKGYGLAMAALILPYLPMLWWQWDLLTAQQKMTGFSFIPPLEMLHTLLLNHSRGFMPEPHIAWLMPLFFLGLTGMLLGWGEIGGRVPLPAHQSEFSLSAWRRYLMLWTWLLCPIACIYVLSLRQPIFTDRYIFWIAPVAMIFLALGAQAVWNNAGRILRYGAVLLVAYTLAFWLYAGWQQKTLPMKYDLRSGVHYLMENRTPDELLLLQIPHLQYAVRYYSSDLGARPFEGADERVGWWAEGLWTNNGWPDEEARALADQQMRELVGAAPEVWVLRSEVEMWDQRHLMEEWLMRHGTLVDAADYHGVQVRHYVLSP